jgi:carbon monoxide dehydrogenase subunit G
MLLKNSFEVAQPVDKVWQFFQDVPHVAACLPGAELTDDLGDDKYLGCVDVSMGPVKLQFKGHADVVERDEAAKRLVVDASGADERGRGQASMVLRAHLVPLPKGTRVDLDQDLQLSGAAAQFGRGMVGDVTAVLMQQFAANVQRWIEAADRGVDPAQVASAAPASGFAIGFRAVRIALARVFARFFKPYQPRQS